MTLDEIPYKPVGNASTTFELNDEKERREKLLDRLERCAAKLESESRELIIEYYSGEQRIKIERRRAFVLASAETQIISLWAVSDYVTRELMTTYYKALKQGQGRGAALRQAQLDMLRRPDRLHPFYWASFIQSGEWANLDGRR